MKLILGGPRTSFAVPRASATAPLGGAFEPAQRHCHWAPCAAETVAPWLAGSWPRGLPLGGPSGAERSEAGARNYEGSPRI